MIPAVFVFAATWLLFPAGPERVPGPWVVVVPVVVIAAPLRPGWALLAIAGGGGWFALRSARGRRRTAEEAAAGVGVALDTVAAELRAGRSALDALAAARSDLPALTPAVEAARLGGDVPAELRSLSGRAGLGQLRRVAAAWHLAERSGSGLADAATALARDLRVERATLRLVTGELAAARATARLVAGLPLLVWLIGSGSGADPVGFLLGAPLGWACLGIGGSLLLAGLVWLEAIARAAAP